MNNDTPNNAEQTAIEVGSGMLRYQVADSWPILPPDWDLVEVAGVATDSQDRVYVFNRGEHSVGVFSPDGKLLNSWGAGVFACAHGITIGPDDVVYCVDHFDHTVKLFSPGGELLRTLGVSGQFSDTGATTVDYRTIRRAGPPFNFPTNLAVGPEGDLFAADGYGNARVHKFSPEGTLLCSWGEPGDGPGQFRVPHGIALDADGTVYVADRENSRIQLFTSDGRFMTEWNDIARPCEVFVGGDERVYVAELGYRAGMWPGTQPPEPSATGGRVSIFNRQGELLARWGGGENPCGAGDFFAPHDIWVDSRGDIYVGEVTMSAGGNCGLVPRGCHCIQKFVRR